VYLTCSKKLTGSQLSPPHGTNKKLNCETKNKTMSMIGPVQSRKVMTVKHVEGPVYPQTFRIGLRNCWLTQLVHSALYSRCSLSGMCCAQVNLSLAALIRSEFICSISASLSTYALCNVCNVSRLTAVLILWLFYEGLAEASFLIPLAWVAFSDVQRDVWLHSGKFFWFLLKVKR